MTGNLTMIAFLTEQSKLPTKTGTRFTRSYPRVNMYNYNKNNIILRLFYYKIEITNKFLYI